MVLPDDIKLYDPPKSLREDRLMASGAQWNDVRKLYMAQLHLLPDGKTRLTNSELITSWVYSMRARLPGPWKKETPGPKSVPKESSH